MANILIVEKDREIAYLMQRTVEARGYQVETVMSSDQKIVDRLGELLEKNQQTLSLIVIDFPPYNLLLAQLVEHRPNAVALVLIESTMAETWAALYEAEANVIPLANWPKTLTKAIAALLRHLSYSGDIQRQAMLYQLTVQDLTLDREVRKVKRGQEKITLTKLEFRILWELALKAGAVLSYEELANRVYGQNSEVDGLVLLKGHIRNIRRKLGDNAFTPIYIETINGIGYRLIDRLSAQTD